MTLREVFSSIANAIRSKTGKTDTIKPVDMATEIESIKTGDGLPQLVDGTITTIAADDLAGVTKVRDYAFWFCSSLTSITIPNSVTSIGASAFSNCKTLTQITIPDSVTSISGFAFTSCGFTQITLPNNLKSIEDSLFTSCKSLTEVIIPNSVTSIKTGVFSECSALTSVVIPDSVTSIGNGAFAYCTSLTSINIPDGVTKIENYLFNYCSSLAELTIPANVTSIGSSALRIGTDTNKATIIMKPTTPPTLGSSAISSTRLNKIIVPAGYGETYKAATNWSALADYIEEESV